MELAALSKPRDFPMSEGCIGAYSPLSQSLQQVTRRRGLIFTYNTAVVPGAG